MMTEKVSTEYLKLSSLTKNVSSSEKIASTLTENESKKYLQVSSLIKKESSIQKIASNLIKKVSTEYSGDIPVYL